MTPGEYRDVKNALRQLRGARHSLHMALCMSQDVRKPSGQVVRARAEVLAAINDLEQTVKPRRKR